MQLTPDDRVALTALVHAYAAAVDGRDGDALRALFTVDGRLTSHVDPAAPRTFLGEGLPALVGEIAAFDRTLHEVVRHHFALSSAGASGDVACVAHHVRAADGGATDLVLTVRYDDCYAVEEGLWRFVSRDVRLLWSERRPVRVP